jgi:hypothetical protein
LTKTQQAAAGVEPVQPSQVEEAARLDKNRIHRDVKELSVVPSQLNNDLIQRDIRLFDMVLIEEFPEKYRRYQ